MKHLMVTIEAAFPIEPGTDIAQAIQSGLDELRGEGAARVVKYDVIEDEKEYEAWYKSDNRIQTAEIPQPTTISWD